MNGNGEQRAAIGRALGRLPSGLFVLTAGRGEQATGMIASWVQQVGFEPPALIVALKKGRPLEPLIRADGVFCLAVLDKGCKALLAHFARVFVPGEPAFQGVPTATSSLGVVYPRAAHAHLVCRLLGVAEDWTDHAVVCGEVVGGDGRLDTAPLVHVRKTGFSY